ncbi:MAG: hypothetical protein C3F18_01360 [Nitrosomonadales bacterium]|nr:MAG: hypothetical protein C3F18_01360 [Nitrosomonadales bacterium]
MRRFAAAALACIAWAVNTAQAGLPYEPDIPLYFDHFDPGQKPWQPGQALNIEEVFKNYQYYEIRFLKQGTEIQVQRYIHNQRDCAERYHVMPDGSLEKITQ